MTTFASLESYLGTFAPEMALRVERGLRPLFDPEQDTLSEAVRACAGEAMRPNPPARRLRRDPRGATDVICMAFPDRCTMTRVWR